MAIVGKKIYWIGWARKVGEVIWCAEVSITIDDAQYGWRWIEDNRTIRYRHTHSLCMLRADETPYKVSLRG